MFGFLKQKSCLLCHAPNEDAVCEGCLNDLRRLYLRADTVCPLCAAVSVNAAVCGHCQNHPPRYARLWASAEYAAPLPALLHEWKHLSRNTFSAVFQTLMRENPPPWLPESGADCILAMPLSRQRRLFRGFNQCDETAETAADIYGLPVLSRDTVFRQHKPPQSTLSQAERRRNVRGVFQAAPSVKNRKILIMDDVLTTGATLSELARSLRHAGASAVFVWVLARNRGKNI